MSEQEKSTAIVTLPQGQTTAFTNMATLKEAMQMAEVLSKSDIIPKEFANKPANCLIAMEFANRLGESPFVIMQNVSVINGKPGLSSKYLIFRINNSGLFRGPLEFEFTGGTDDKPAACYAWALRKSDGRKLRGTAVTMEMAQAEGWLTRDRSKWKTMPRKMMLYRAASFFANEICPQVCLGMFTVEEIQDITYTDVSGNSKIDALNAKITDKSAKSSDKKRNDEII